LLSKDCIFEIDFWIGMESEIQFEIKPDLASLTSKHLFVATANAVEISLSRKKYASVVQHP